MLEAITKNTRSGCWEKSTQVVYKKTNFRFSLQNHLKQILSELTLCQFIQKIGKIKMIFHILF